MCISLEIILIYSIKKYFFIKFSKHCELNDRTEALPELSESTNVMHKDSLSPASTNIIPIKKYIKYLCYYY